MDRPIHKLGKVIVNSAIWSQQKRLLVQVSFHIKRTDFAISDFSEEKLSFDFEGDNREVLGKVSMSYVSKANAARMWRPKFPVGTSKNRKRRVARPGITTCRRLPSTTSMMRI